MPTVKIDELPKNSLKLTITVPVDEVHPYMEEAAVRLSEKSAIPGFRPGKAPAKVIRQLYAQRVRHEITGDLSVAGHRHGTFLGKHPIAAEISRELGSGYGLGLCHIDTHR